HRRRGAGQLRQDLVHHRPALGMALPAGRIVRDHHLAAALWRHRHPGHAQGPGAYGLMQTPGSRSLPPRPAQMLPEVTPAMRTAEAWRRLTGRSRSSHPPRSGALLSGDPVSLGPDTSRGVILYLEDLTVSFDGFKALNALTLYVATGELRCIIGPNGAGKTTMMDDITGKTRPDKGSAWFGQTLDLLTLTEPQIAEAGLGS